MKKRFALSSIVIASALVLTACATQPASRLVGHWKPVNRYAGTPQEIPLQQNYVFFISPLDGTLKNALGRWAKDSKMTLSYLHSSDFTLHAQAADIHTTNLRDALGQLSAAYVWVVGGGNAWRVAIHCNSNRLCASSLTNRRDCIYVIPRPLNAKMFI